MNAYNYLPINNVSGNFYISNKSLKCTKHDYLTDLKSCHLSWKCFLRGMWQNIMYLQWVLYKSMCIFGVGGFNRLNPLNKCITVINVWECGKIRPKSLETQKLNRLSWLSPCTRKNKIKQILSLTMVWNEHCPSMYSVWVSKNSILGWWQQQSSL